MLKFEILMNGERHEVTWNQFRSWAGRRFINGTEYHSPYIYNHLSLERASRKQARACDCPICSGPEEMAARPEWALRRLASIQTMEQVRQRIFLRMKRANRLKQDTMDEARQVEGMLEAYLNILEDTFRIEGAIK